VKVSELVGQTLASLGVGHAFGVVGSGNFEVTNALRAGGVPFVAARHEGGAATMADAYSRMSGRPAVVTTHQGCGLTNALTGIGEAAKSRTPLLVLSGEATAVRSNFYIDQAGVVEAVGAVADRVHSAASAVEDVRRAFRTAVEERRTVLLNLPLDVQASEAPPRPLTRQQPEPEPAEASTHRLKEGKRGELVAAIRGARRVVFVAGRGARHAGGPLRELAHACGALLATSAVANGLFHDDPWSLGISGGFASPLAAELISSADLVVGWGCALNMWTTRHGRLIGPDATVAQVDLDESVFIGDVGVVGDTAETARKVLAALGPERREGFRTADVGARIAREIRWRDVPFDDNSTAERIDPRTLSVRLDDLLPAERIVSVDSGNFMGYPSAYLEVSDEYGFCFTQAFQSIGLGLATAIGAALARPDRLPVAALGDGGFLMSVAELETVVRLGLPMVIVVYNDNAYGAEVHHFTGQDTSTVTFPDTDIAAIGRGFGAAGITVRTEADLGGLSEWLAGPRDRPLLIDAKITSDGGSWWLAEAFRGH
jgi:thiamine pyrophosphate-dependent acetolactate synthase large subunit-like protein